MERPRKKDKWRMQNNSNIEERIYREKLWRIISTRDRNEQKNRKRKKKNYRKISKRNQEKFFDDALWDWRKASSSRRLSKKDRERVEVMAIRKINREARLVQRQREKLKKKLRRNYREIDINRKIDSGTRRSWKNIF